MKYYSETLHRIFDTEAELVKMEAEVKKKEEEKARAEKVKTEARAKRAKEVELALKKANEAQKEAMILLKEFTKDYGYFHYSYTDDDVKEKKEHKESLSNFIDEVLSLF